MNEWKVSSIGDICEKVVSGGTPLTSRRDYYQNGTIPWLKTKEINQCRIYKTENRITQLGLENSSAKLLPKDTVTIAMYGDGQTAGRVGLIKIPLATNQACCNLIIDRKIADPDFVFYFLRGSYSDLVAKKSGSGQQNLNAQIIKAFQIPLPTLGEQRVIGSLLTCLDEKIDLLHRENKTLESLIEVVFRKRLVESAQEDWLQVELEGITSRITDGAHASPSTVEKGFPMASVKDMYQWGIHTGSCRQISKSDFDELVRTDCRPLKNDILIAKDGSYLKHVFVVEKDMDVVVLSSIAILRPNGKYHPLLLTAFLKLSSTKEALENMVTGAVIPRIVLKDFRKYKLLLPPQSAQDQAILIIEPMYKKCWENDRQIRTLEKLRDTLLPKLMSGEVRVAH